MDAPFAAFFMVASTWAIVISLLARKELLRNVALLCSSVLFGLAVIESGLYYVTKPQVIVTRTAPEEWRRDSIGLGALPVPKTATEFREFLDGRLITDVTYGIDARGLREIPLAAPRPSHKIAFFGCSYMFGHGVEDDQTLPFYFVQEARGTFEGFNFAGEGWGPHQMLRELETGFVRRVAGAPELAIYEVIPDHLRRVAGRAPWEDGPKYELCPGEGVCYAGPFHSSFYAIFRRWFSGSWTIRFLGNYFARLSRPADLPLFLAVLKRTRFLLEESGSRLVIVLWDQNDLAKAIMRTLSANHFEVIEVSAVVAESDLTKPPITQLDRHPSPATNQAIARYLWKMVGAPLAKEQVNQTK
jgi:hypothetical protein